MVGWPAGAGDADDEDALREGLDPSTAAPGRSSKMQRLDTAAAVLGVVLQRVPSEFWVGTGALEALRRTCRTFCCAVDASVVALSSSKFNTWSRDSVDALVGWGANAGWVRRTRSLSIAGELTTATARRVAESIDAHRPAISRIELLGAGSAGETLLAARLPTLRHLSVFCDFAVLDFARDASSPAIAAFAGI